MKKLIILILDILVYKSDTVWFMENNFDFYEDTK